MAKSVHQEPKSAATKTWIARDSKSGRFVEVKSATRSPASAKIEGHATESKPVSERRPGRFRDVLSVGPEFFEPLSERELEDLNGV